MKPMASTLLLASSLAGSLYGQSTVLWNESINGQLSQFAASPTSLGSLQKGTNSVLSSVEFVPTGGGPGGTLYSDFFTFSAGASTSISGVYLSVDSPIAVWIGDTNFSIELGSVISPASGNLFSQIGVNSVGVGEYGIYVSNYDHGPVRSIITYRLDFIVQPIPEPITAWLLIVGLVCFGCRASIRRR